ncbi:MAG TPA: isoprenylcysteine carboxylmethyltransferase family protein [Bdellovibrionota bacterium]|jgi:protein-S-isoprenylcysteine O-methyltransferase Ste14|nr:isoprenylcysteine carboxylmethyltransferase family protein [Bdellovibrionota bacterium]
MEPILTHVTPHKSWLRSLIRGRTRIGLAWVFAFALLFLSRKPPALPGMALCFVGACLRVWASGFLRKDAAPSVGGPYGLTRNPLYLGTYLMAVGTAWAVENLWLFLAASILFAGIYHFIILEEEEKLREIFGPAYLRYLDSVPRFFPRPWPPKAAVLDTINPQRAQRRFDWTLAKKNRAHEPLVSFAGLMALVWLVSLAWNYLTAASH